MPRLRALLGYGALAGLLLLCLKLISLAPLAVDWGRELVGATLALLAVAVGWRLAHRAESRDQRAATTAGATPAMAPDAAAHSVTTAPSDLAIAPLADTIAMTIGEPLSPREQEVLRLLGAGRSNKEIARALHLSENTVKTHLAKVYTKLGVGRRTEALAVALQRGLL